MVICYAYFNYKQKCAKENCQWYHKGLPCCMEMPREKWGTKEDKKFIESINNKFEEQQKAKREIQELVK